MKKLILFTAVLCFSIQFSNALPGSVVSGMAPTVNITSPYDQASYTAPATILLSADAKDEDGKIRKVEFYNGSTLIGIEKNVPFLRKWYNVPAGEYIITAKATDNTGKSTTSVPVHIRVLPGNFFNSKYYRPG